MQAPRHADVCGVWRKAAMSAVLALLPAFAMVSCAAAPWLRSGEVHREVDGLLLWMEPGVRVEGLRTRLDEVRAFHRAAQNELTPGRGTVPLRLAVYASAASYAALRPVAVDSVAHFHRESRVIHIPASAPAEAWRHETVHAVLHEHNPNLPFWLQEGSALLFQGANETALCRGQVLRLPPGVLAYRNLLASRPRPLPIALRGEAALDELYLDTSQAAFFAFYLWQRGQLLSVIQHQPQNPDSTPFLLLTGGDLHRNAALSAEFNEWLKTSAAIGASSGC